MASPNLVLANTSPGGSTIGYLVELTNNVASYVNKGVYTDGVTTSPNANVVIDGSVSSGVYVVKSSNGSISFTSNASVQQAYIGYSSNTLSLDIVHYANTATKLQLFSNNYMSVGGIKIINANDLAATVNTINTSISSSANATLTSATSLINLAVPPGTIVAFAGNTAPNTWFEADGSAKSRATYSNLFNAIGTTFGAANTSTFNIPDLRGEFVRGWDHGRGIDTGRTLGSFQDQSVIAHTHTGTTASAGSHIHTATEDSQGAHVHTASADVQGAHGHGVNDSGHAHGIYDPGHTHNITAHYSGGTGGNIVGNGVGATAGSEPTDTSYTGIQTYAAGTGISIAANGNHSHNITVASAGAHTHNITVIAGGAHSHTFTTDSTGGTETRPRNVAMMMIIKY